MKRLLPVLLAHFCAAILAAALAPAAFAGKPHQPVYREPNEYPVLDQIVERREALAATADSLQAVADAAYAAAQEARGEAEMSLRVDWSRVPRPGSPDDFKVRLAHLPPTPQFYTGSCWAFSATSLMESEVIRLTGREIKLSEMWTVYWEYVEKVRRWVREYGHSVVEEGSQGDGVLEVYKLYGAVPKSAYAGVKFADGRHDHHKMLDEIHSFLDHCRDQHIWDEARVLPEVRRILDNYMGPPPESFQWEGASMTPQRFLADVLTLDPDDYVSCVSRMDTEFGQWCLLDVTDNWRRSDRFLNLPLDTFYKVVKDAIKDGYTVDFGGDNSEPGVDGKYDCADIPPWDIPADYIDQGSREHRIVSRQTTDDHGVHIVGYTKVKGRDWYLMKDSNRSSRLGNYKGYYFFSGDYLKLKMLAFMVHKDRLEGLLPD